MICIWNFFFLIPIKNESGVYPFLSLEINIGIIYWYLHVTLDFGGIFQKKKKKKNKFACDLLYDIGCDMSPYDIVYDMSYDIACDISHDIVHGMSVNVSDVSYYLWYIKIWYWKWHVK